ncbi:hypothetical protein [Alistipes sp.]|uniref:hypothetical protein n=1 Tax=Alistipes sp. TaxID=1872444 RepID=UPI003AF108C6
MESMKLALMQRIRAELPELALVDEDYGQLETDEDQYPVVFPCVLVSIPKTEWTTQSAVRPIRQRGTATLNVKLAIDCYDDTHIGSSTEEKVLEREAMNDHLFRAVQGYKHRRETSALARTESTEYPLGGGVKVYMTSFQYSEMMTE